MSKNSTSKKSKIIQFKDIISIMLIVIIITITLTGVLGNSNNNSIQYKEVTTRNLAMFASLAYANLEELNNGKYIKKDTNLDQLTFKDTQMVTDGQLEDITSSTLLGLVPLSRTQENTYSYLFYGLASTKEVEDWKIVNYAKIRTTLTNGSGLFTAMTFKRGNDIVIAYRGTDFNDAGDWLQDFAYMLISFTGQEIVTQNYALNVAKHYPNSNIYVTGHSLGGYLSQIGGAALVANSSYEDNVKQIAYFNGMGLNFTSNLKNHLNNKIKLNKYGISNSEVNQFKNPNSKFNSIQYNAEKSLRSWYNNNSNPKNIKDGKLVSYYINGDLISAAGTHVGKQIGFDAYKTCIDHHEGNQLSTNVLVSTIFKGIKPFLNKDVSVYVKQYKPISLLSYVWITHETDSFFGVLPFDNGALPGYIEVKLNVPSSIKRNKAGTATLVVTTTGGRLQTTRLTTSNFTITNTTALKITSITGPSTIKTSTGYKYTYTLNLKGGSIIGLSQIKLKSNVLRLIPSHNYVLPLVTNDSLISNIINTKLR